MNIKEAKKEIINTVRAYTQKDERGFYCMEAMRQRPILLIGPPGVGKTAVMEQAARECGIGLVAYTITHHTRQSAVGLPVVVSKNYDGREVRITEYTMSEIIASVYECMERTGCREGILFIDEINCVSETLSPTMLQFLQNKTFGTHPVPKGWVIVAAGNPPEYNRSAREFDIVTLDRVKRIDVEPDVEVWKEYAYEKGLHPCIISYLNLKKDSFYYIENTALGKDFVTAKGWEDLSVILQQYERLGIEAGAALFRQYLQAPEIAREFASYYELYCKNAGDYHIPEILQDGISPDDSISMAKAAKIDERLMVAGFLLEGWNTYFQDYHKAQLLTKRLHEVLKKLLPGLETGKEDLEEYIKQFEHALEVKQSAGLLDGEKLLLEERVLSILRSYQLEIKKHRAVTGERQAGLLRELFESMKQQRTELIQRTSQALERGFSFAEKAFGNGPELTLLVAELTVNPLAMDFLRRHGCDAYFACSDRLLLQKKREEILGKMEGFLGETFSL